MARHFGYFSATAPIRSRSAYLAIRNDAVAARVAETETIAVPCAGPKMAPADMVSGMAGTARISSRTYSAMNDAGPAGPSDSTYPMNHVRYSLMSSL